MGFLTAAHEDRARGPACLAGTGGVYNCDVAGTVMILSTDRHRMPPTAEHKNWAAAVDSIVRCAPRSASQPDPPLAQVRLLALLSSPAPPNVLLDGPATYVETSAHGLHCAVPLGHPTRRLLGRRDRAVGGYGQGKVPLARQLVRALRRRPWWRE